MSNTFPVLSSGSMTLHGSAANNALMQYPSSFGTSYSTRVIKFLNDKEQRWLTTGPLFSAVLEYRKLTGYDASLLYEFFEQMRGAYSDTALTNTFSITVSGVTYNYCVFDQDSLELQIDREELISTSIRLKQLRPN